MGELYALLSTICFAAANITIVRGAGGKGQDNGAFLSILMTAAIAGLVWVAGSRHGQQTPLSTDALLWFAAAGVLTLFLGRVFLFASVQHLGAVRGSAVKRLNPLFAVLMGVLVLGESMDGVMAFGMLLIFASFGVLMWQSLRPDEQSPAGTGHWFSTLANLGFIYGPVSALAYATGYVARKFGLEITPDPAFGTMVGAVTGASLFLLTACFVRSYRVAVRGTFSGFKPWLMAAAVLSSVGQLLYFAALNHSSISKVALITSMEVFLTMFLSIVVFRSGERITGPVMAAAILGVAGTALLVLH